MDRRPTCIPAAWTTSEIYGLTYFGIAVVPAISPTVNILPTTKQGLGLQMFTGKFGFAPQYSAYSNLFGTINPHSFSDHGQWRHSSAILSYTEADAREPPPLHWESNVTIMPCPPFYPWVICISDLWELCKWSNQIRYCKDVIELEIYPCLFAMWDRLSCCHFFLRSTKPLTNFSLRCCFSNAGTS